MSCLAILDSFEIVFGDEFPNRHSAKKALDCVDVSPKSIRTWTPSSFMLDLGDIKIAPQTSVILYIFDLYRFKFLWLSVGVLPNSA